MSVESSMNCRNGQGRVRGSVTMGKRQWQESFVLLANGVKSQGHPLPRGVTVT